MFAVLEGSWNHEVAEVISIQQTEQAKNRIPPRPTPPQKKRDLDPIFQVHRPVITKR